MWCGTTCILLLMARKFHLTCCSFAIMLNELTLKQLTAVSSVNPPCSGHVCIIFRYHGDCQIKVVFQIYRVVVPPYQFA